MSFTGIFKAKNGIVAVVDSKASRVENGQSYEDVHRNPEKLFVFQNGIATTFGANQILVQNPFEFSSKVIAIEDLVYEYLHLKNILDASFFQSLLVKMTSNPANTEPVNFLVGRKIRQEEYILEHHQVRYCAYAQRLQPQWNISLLAEMKNIGNTLITFHIFHRSPLLIYCRKLLQKNWMD